MQRDLVLRNTHGGGFDAGRAADVGVIVNNVSTAAAVHRAVRFGEPLIRRIVTINGGAKRTTSGRGALTINPRSSARRAISALIGSVSTTPRSRPRPRT